jgi:hypothetical protein
MNILRSQAHTGTVPLFEIRLDSAIRDVIVLRGSPGECPGTTLTGVVVLSLHDPVQARSITLTLKGKSRARYA